MHTYSNNKSHAEFCNFQKESSLLLLTQVYFLYREKLYSAHYTQAKFLCVQIS